MFRGMRDLTESLILYLIGIMIDKNFVTGLVNERGTNKQAEASNNGRKYLVNHLTKQISIKKYIEEIRSLDDEIIVERKSIYEQ